MPRGPRARLARGLYGRLASRRWIAVTGPDAGTHLHAMLTRDLSDLAEGGVRYAALVDDRAHYLADAWVLRPEGEWWLDAPAPVADRLRERLSLFAVASDVTLHDAAPEHALFHWEGGAAGHVASALGMTPAGGRAEGGRAGSRLFEGARCLWAERSHFGESGVTCLVPGAAASTFEAALREAAEALALQPLTPEAEVRLRIEAGRPLGGVDVGEADLLPEAGLWGALSLDKGCFPGQEILQRVARRGRIQRRLVGVAGWGDWTPAAGEAVEILDRAGAERGIVTSWAPGAEGEETIGLAWVRRPEEHAADSWQVAVPGGASPCRLVEPPFVPLGLGRLVDAVAPETAQSRTTAES